MAQPALHGLRWSAKDRPNLGAPGIAGRDDLFAATCGNGDRNSCESHAGGDTAPGTHRDGIVLYPGFECADSTKIMIKKNSHGEGSAGRNCCRT